MLNWMRVRGNTSSVKLLLLLAVLAPGVGVCVDQSTQAPTEFKIPAENLADALSKFGAQTGLQVVYAPELARGVISQALSGRLTIDAALKQLLAGTGLTWQYVNGSTVVLKRTSSSSSASALADQLRLATTAGTDKDEGKSAAQSGEAKDTPQVVVQDKRIKPFTDANVDLPRTVDDAQPYYIFDAKSIERSGTVNVEEFLKQKLTMNMVGQTNAQNVSYGAVGYGNLSSINLRGLGDEKTLVLVNGRRLASVHTSGAERQSDINGIPLSAIERIEVLPSSASGIYGGSAMGGLVNIITKRDYRGGQVQVTYDNTFDADAPTRTLSASYGLAPEGGRTQITLNAAWSDSHPLLLQDRRNVIEPNLQFIRQCCQNWLTDYDVWVGTVPNIITYDGVPLTLKDGRSLGSDITFVPPGTSPDTPTTELYDGLLANAGRWNFDFPPALGTYGLIQPFTATLRSRSLRLGARREMSAKLELFVDLFYDENESRSPHDPVYVSYYLEPDSPSNIFDNEIYVSIPNQVSGLNRHSSTNRGISLGLLADLPRGWKGEFDYSWSENHYQNSYLQNALTFDIFAEGSFNPFVDLLQYPLPFEDYLTPYTLDGSMELHDFAARGSGHMPALPWGTPELTAGLEHRVSKLPGLTQDNVYRRFSIEYYPRDSVTDSLYLETKVPLVKVDWLPLVHGLELQAAGRIERFTVDTGTRSKAIDVSLDPPGISYSGLTRDGEPYFSRTSYRSNNYTIGLKYQPIESVALRVSRASAFLPPTPLQLSPPSTSAYLFSVHDPVNDTTAQVEWTSGGNPDLQPQSSRSLNVGVIWQPLTDLRFNVEYYEIEQFDAISTLGLQQTVDMENTYPTHVIRDESGTITRVDTTYLNLFRDATAGWDLSADWTARTRAGTFTFNAAGSRINSLETQYSIDTPSYDAAGFSTLEGGGPRYKANASVYWESGGWTLGWTTRYISSYKMYGVPGGPLSVQFAGGGAYYTFSDDSGIDSVPAQTYHDLLVSYRFDTIAAARAMSGWLSGLTIQVGIRNVFDKAPAFDGADYYNLYLSPFGDIRMRSGWLKVSKSFGS